MYDINPKIIFKLKKLYPKLNFKKVKTINKSVIKFDSKIVKGESNKFHTIFSDIEKLYEIYDKKYIPNYTYLNSSYLYCYDYIPGKSLNKFKINFLNKRKFYKSTLTYIKKTISIPEDFLFKIKKENILNYDTLDSYLHILCDVKNEKRLNKKDTKLINKLVKINSKIENIIQPYDKKILYYHDFNFHNFIVDKKNNINRIDLTEGLSFADFNKCISLYFMLLWYTGDKTLVKKGIQDCNINDLNDIIFKKSLILFCYKKIKSAIRCQPHHKIKKNIFNKNIYKCVEELSQSS